MSDQLTLTAETRERGGKGASRELRRNGRVPAVVYGGKEEPLMIHVEEKLLRRQLGTGHFMNSIVMIEVGGKKLRTLPKDVALDPVTDRPIHVDFLRLSKDAVINVMVPVHFVDEDKSVGMKKGAVLNVVRHEVELICPADSIPEQLNVSVAGKDVGDSIHISNVTLPAGVTAVIDRDFTIATLIAPSALKSETDAAGTEATEEAEG